MARLLYATPTGSHPKIGFVASLRAIELTVRSFERQLGDFQFTLGPVQRARSAIVDRALNDGYDFLVMQDDDMVLAPTVQHGNPIDAWHAIFNAQPGVGMIGAVYLREKPMMPNIVIEHPVYPEELCHAIAGYPDIPFNVGGIGTGFVMIRVEALRKLADDEDHIGRPPMFRFDQQTSRWGMTSEVGEDYGFCRRLTSIGYKVVADPRFPTTHIKDRGPLLYDHTNWEKKWALDEAADSPVVKELREYCPPTFKLVQHNGFLMLDHTEERIRMADEWKAQSRKAA